MNALERRIRKLEEREPTVVEFLPIEWRPNDPRFKWVPPSERPKEDEPRWQLRF